jgi:hypothetical protein
VPELWFWRKNKITAYALEGGAYVELVGSKILLGIDLAALNSFIDRPTTSQSIREYRASLLGR